MTITQIKYLLSLYDLRSYSKAAKHLHVSQPTLSMQVKKIEEQFGKPLIEKGSIPIQFTSLGERVVEEARILIEDYENLEHLAKDSRGEKDLSIAIGVIPTIACYLIPALSSWAELNLKDVRIEFQELTTEELIPAVQNSSVDMGILSGPLDTYLNSKHLYYEPIIPYLNASRRSISIKELANLKGWVLAHGNCFRVQMERLCGSSEHGKVSYEGRSLSTLVSMVNEIGGYTLLPKHCIGFINTNPKLVKSFEEGVNPARDVISIARKRNPKQNLQDQINDWLSKKFHYPGKDLEIVDWN